MTSNSIEIIQDIRAEFEIMLEYVTGDQAKQATADQIERGLFKRLLCLGAKLLTLFFVIRSQASSRAPLERDEGQVLGYHRDTKRIYLSIFGQVVLWRPYFYRSGLGGQTPLDAELGLGEGRYSDLVREISEYLGVYSVYHKSSDILGRLLGLPLSTRVIEEVIAQDASDVQAYYAQRPAPQPETEAEVLVVQADGKGVPIVYDPQAAPPRPVRLGKGQKRGRKQEAVVTTVYTIPSQPRTPQQVVDSYFNPDQPQPKAKGKRIKPHNKHLWATMDGKDAALDRLQDRTNQREGPHIQARVALCDGCEALQKRLKARFPTFTLILDFIHADEYLWEVANALYDEKDPQRLTWMIERTHRLLSGQTEQLIAEFRKQAQDDPLSAHQRTQLTKTANYFERNRPYMDYQTYLERGWPIASGVIEGACRHFVKDRCELSGMRWTQQGVEALFRLRAVAENDDWDDYHLFRKRQRHLRLYKTPYPDQSALEIEVLDTDPVVTTHSSTPTEPDKRAVPGCRSKPYHQLSLAT